MNKAVLLSIKPQYCELIASGKKTVEVRKTRPKIETPFKCYIYCTLSGSNEFFKETCNGDIAEWNRSKMAFKKGKVIGEFMCDKVDCYPFVEDEDEIGMIYPVSTAEGEKTCLEYDEVEKYGAGKPLYFWHISDLAIYDKPKELSEFKPICRWMNDDFSCMYRKVGCSKVKFDMNPDNTVNLATCTKRLSKAPQSWCYVEELEAEQCSGMTF